MKKVTSTLLLGFLLVGVCFSQEQEDTWKGTIRFNPADVFINLHNALPGISATWTPHIMPNLGIPVELDVHIGWGVLPGVQISLLSGVEYFPPIPAGREKDGLVLDAKAGLSLYINEEVNPAFITKVNAGYQIITRRGLVFLPGAGVVYNGHSGFGLNILFAVGFAYR